MTLTRDFKEAVRDRVKRDRRFRKALIADCAENGSGNVFADLGFQDAEELNAKVTLVSVILRHMKLQRLSAAATSVLKIDALELNALKSYDIDAFSVWGLMTFLPLLGHDVEIRVVSKASSKKPGKVRVACFR
jgi:predicted XRE-type DNA-binding protein